MTTDERIEKLEIRVDKLEEKMHEGDLEQLNQYHELEKLIQKAVEKGNEPIAKKLEEQEKRIVVLEQKDGEKAKAILHSIIATSLAWLVTGILTNLPTIIGVFKK